MERNCFFFLHVLQYYALNCATNNVVNTKNMSTGCYKIDCQINKKDKSKFDIGRINFVFEGEFIELPTLDYIFF